MTCLLSVADSNFSCCEKNSDYFSDKIKQILSDLSASMDAGQNLEGTSTKPCQVEFGTMTLTELLDMLGALHLSFGSISFLAGECQQRKTWSLMVGIVNIF